MLSHFHLIPELYGQTDRIARPISISRVSLLKKLCWTDSELDRTYFLFLLKF